MREISEKETKIKEYNRVLQGFQELLVSTLKMRIFIVDYNRWKDKRTTV